MSVPQPSFFTNEREAPEPDDVALVGATDPWRLVFWGRYVSIPLLALLLVSGLFELDHDWALATVILIGTLPATIGADVVQAAQPRWRNHLIELDVMVGATCLVIDSRVLPILVAVMITNMAMTAAVAGVKSGLRTSVFSTVVFFVALIIVSDAADAGYLLSIYGAAGTVLAVVVGSVADGKRALVVQQSLLLDGIEGIVWESKVAPPTKLTIAGHVESILGARGDELGEVDGWVHWIHSSDVNRAMRQLDQLITGSDPSGQIEYRVIARGGRIVHVRDHIQVDRDHHGRAVRVRGLVVDISVQRQAEQELSHYHDIVENIHTALLVIRQSDPDDPRSLMLVAANPAASKLLGRRAKDFIGSRIVDAFPILRAGSIPERLIETITMGIGFDSEMPLADDPDAPIYAVHTFPLPDRSVAMALTDVTDRARVEARIRHQALHDALTGLPNRVLLNDRLRDGLNHARRGGEPVAIMIMDLNHFKEVNDTLGHHSGDVLLSVIASRLRESLREADTIARLGGDEFAIVLTTNATQSGAEAVATKIAELVERPVNVDGVTIQVGASIGIAFFPEHADDADDLAKRADVAMYVAKRAGIPFAVYAAEDDRSSIRRLTLLGELRQAITSNQLVLHHQPTIDLATGDVLRTEALLRWRHPQHGLMAPGEFMELAEMSGVIQPLTRWVLRQSIRQVQHLDDGNETMHVAVNVSARNLYEPDLVDWIRDLLVREDFPGHRLTIEITESLLMDDPVLAFDVLNRLKAFGISLSIDDFGTGYSSLSYLRDLPIDEIKIDQSFVAAMSGPDGDEAIVRSVIDLGHNLGLAVVAEGVEDLDTLNRLVELGCDRAQGYVLSQPLPADELAHVLRSDWFSRFTTPLG